VGKFFPLKSLATAIELIDLTVKHVTDLKKIAYAQGGTEAAKKFRDGQRSVWKKNV